MRLVPLMMSTKLRYLAKFFFSVFSTSNFISTNNDVTVDTSVRQHLVSIDISEEEVLKALNSLARS